MGVDEVRSELNFALSKCRAHIARQMNDDQRTERLCEAMRDIERAVELLKLVE